MKDGRPHFLTSILKGATGQDDIDIPKAMLYLIEQGLLEWMHEVGKMNARSAEVAGERFLNEILQMRIDDLPKDLWNKFINRLADIYAKTERRLRMSADAFDSMCRKHPTWPLFEDDLRSDALPIIKEYIVKCLRNQDVSSYFREVIQLYDDRDFFWNIAVPIACKDESIWRKVLFYGLSAFYFSVDAAPALFKKLEQKHGIVPPHFYGNKYAVGSGDPCDASRLRCRREFYRTLVPCVLRFMELAGQSSGWNDRTMDVLFYIFYRVRRAADEVYDRVWRAANEAARPN